LISDESARFKVFMHEVDLKLELRELSYEKRREKNVFV
jgi:hypothetical protein